MDTKRTRTDGDAGQVILLWGKGMRKNLLLPIISMIMLIPCVFASCKPKLEQMYGVGDVWSDDRVNIQLNSSEYTVDRIESIVTLELTFTINTTSEYRINDDGIYVYLSAEEKINTITEKNEDVNGFDILDRSITETEQYTFFFVLSLDHFTDENGEIMTGSWRVHCFIRPATFAFTIKI